MKSFLRSFPPFTYTRRAVVTYWRKTGHSVLVNCLGGLSLHKKSVIRLNDSPDVTIAFYRGRNETTQ